MKFDRYKRLTDIFGLDPRSLAVLRIGLGLILLGDLALRASDLEAMYTNDGILPVAASMKMVGTGVWSLHWLSGAAWFQALLMAAAAALAVGVVVGYRTRWMLLGSWLLLLSLHTRNTLILNGGDGMLRVLLFWAIFLPLGAVWSLDARRNSRNGRPPSAKPVLSTASFCFIVQLCLVYWFAGIFKINEHWLGFNPWDASLDPSLLADATIGGHAMQRAMSYELYTKPLASLLLESPLLLRMMSLGTLAAELCLPLALLIPFGTRWWRMLVITSFALLHIGIELTLHVGVFTWIGLVAWATLLHAMFWNRFHKWEGEAPAEPTNPDGLHRAWLGRSLALPWFAPGAARAVVSVFCLSMLGVVLVWNGAHIFRKSIRTEIQQPLRPIVNVAAMWQHWNMFSKPYEREAWLVYRAELRSGEVVDAFQDRYPLSMGKPADLSATFRNHRWRKLNANLVTKRYSRHRQAVAECIRRTWNARHGEEEQIVRLEVYRCAERRGKPDEASNYLCFTIHADGADEQLMAVSAVR